MRTDAAPAMADGAIFRIGRARMAIVAMLLQPAGGMRVGVGTYVGRVAQCTTCPSALAGVAIIAMGLIPGGVMRLGPGRCMTGAAGILSMTDQAALAVPGGLDAVGLQTPEVVVRCRHRDLVALAAGLFAVAHAAGVIRLGAHLAMPPRPVLSVTWRRRPPVHLLMAGAATHLPTVSLIANPDFFLARKFRDQGQLLVHQQAVAVRAAVRQGFGVTEQSAGHGDGVAGRFGIFRLRQIFGILRLVTLSAGFFADLLGFNPVPMALFTGVVPCGGKMAAGRLSMAVGAGYPVLGNV